MLAAAQDRAGRRFMDELLQIEHFKPYVGKIVRFKGTGFAFPLDRISSNRRRLPKGVKRRCRRRPVRSRSKAWSMALRARTRRSSAA
jgi:hypothetical protein